MPRCVVHCPPEPGGGGVLVALAAVGVAAAAAVAAQALLSVAAALFAVVAVACAVSCEVLRRALLYGRALRPVRRARVAAHIPAALPAPMRALEGRVVGVPLRTAEGERVAR